MGRFDHLFPTRPVFEDAAEAESAEAESAEAESAEAGQYDPAEHNVDDVLAHLATLAEDDPERERILDAERAGKARAGILD